MCVCVCVFVFVPAFKAGTKIDFYIQSEDILTKQGQNFSPRFVVHCSHSSIIWVWGDGRYPLFVHARHV